jgi:hypothetical protein
MNKLAGIIDNLNYDELKAIKKDLDSGNIERLIKEKIMHFDKGRKICPVCYRTIEGDDEHFTLIFGSSDFKKKASFCALDCLEFFISKIKETRKTDDRGYKKSN